MLGVDALESKVHFATFFATNALKYLVYADQYTDVSESVLMRERVNTSIM